MSNNGNNNGNNNNVIAVHRHRHHRRGLGFITSWLLLGIIMMLLNATIWPEVSTNENICWFYKVATLGITMFNKVCEFAFPYLQSAGIWLADFIINCFEWIIAQWPTIISVVGKICNFGLTLFLYGNMMIAFCLIFCLLTIAVTYFIDKKTAVEEWNDFKKGLKEEILEAFNLIVGKNKKNVPEDAESTD